MTLIWLLAWWLSDAPPLVGTWLAFLVICAVCDAL